MKRIFHVADTHIGYSAYRKMDVATGLNQREVDTYEAFTQFVDYALKAKPDAVIHAGDLFDSVRPTNRAISFVLNQLIRLSAAGIPFVAISGNHETPRLKETGSVLSLFEHIPDVHVVYESFHKTVALDGISVHAVPHCDDIEAEKNKLTQNNAGFNIALLHASVPGAGQPTFLMGEFNEQIVGIDDLTDFDYIALGHFHGYTKVKANAYYAGSTERFSFNEVNDTKGFLEVNLRGDSETEVIFHPLKIRAMTDLEPVVCSTLNAQEIGTVIKQRIQECNPQDKVVRLKVQDIATPMYHSLDFDALKQLTKSAVHFEMKYEFRLDSESPYAEQPAFHSLHTEFEKFIGQYTIGTQVDKEKLKALGMKYMLEWENEEERD